MKEQFKNLEQLIKTEYGNIAGIVIQKNGEPVYESYFNGCTDQKRVHIFSVTKSIISLLIGIAIDKGYIHSVSQKVLEFFPDYTIRQREHTIQHITLEHLLTMTAPYKYRYAPYTKYFSSPDWVVSSLNQLGGKDPIGEFRYAPLIGPDILTGIIARASSMSVSAFAEKYLFEPLGISTPGNITFHSIEEQTAFYNAPYSNCWVCDSMGNNTAGWGLTLSARDMAKLGQLCLNQGLWNGKQLISSDWISSSTTEHSCWKDKNLPYGYLWWIIRNSCSYAAMGDGGNVIYVNHDRELVISIASTFVRRPKDRIELILNHIEPLLQQ